MASTTPAADGSALKKNALRISLVAIASVFVFELVAGLSTGSLALLTDSTHALLDAVVTGILMVAVNLAARPRDRDHTYGHGKIETIGGFIGGTALFVVAIFFIYEAASRMLLAAAQQGQSFAVVPGAIGFAAVIYTLAMDALRITVLGRAARKLRGASTLRADLYHALADFASTSVALAGLWLVTAGFQHGDSAAAAILGAFLAYLAGRFAYQNAVELTDRISPGLVERVRAAAAGTEGVLECRDLKMRKVGKDIFTEVTISLKADISFERAHEISAQVERNIAASLGGGAEPNITVHFEPVYSPDLPLETIIERAAVRAGGVKGVHNIVVSRVGATGRLEISLHIQVNRSATLSEAHAIASAVEDSIKGQLKGDAGNVTVHLEPVMPEAAGIEPVADAAMQDSIKGIVMAATSDVKRVGRVATFMTKDNVLRIDVDCVFGRPATIEQVHDLVTDIENRIRDRYPGSIVTIHAEPGA